MSTDGQGRPTDSRWYGRRHGRKLRPARQALLEDALPAVRVALPAAGGRLAPETLFETAPDELWMEIGFGTGEHLAELAARNPGIGFIGSEPFINGVAAMLAKIEQRQLTNVRLFDDDVRLLTPHLPDACLSRLYILFADPWPKKRHRRRRITVRENLAEFARLLADGGRLMLASDQHDFAAWSLANALGLAKFEWTARRPGDWLRAPEGWVPTRYQLKARKKGLHPVFLDLRRRSRAG